MKVWTKVRINQKNKEIDKIVKAYINYLLKDNALSVLAMKYHMEENEVRTVYEQLSARIAGLIILYIGKDQRRLYDILNRYQGDNSYLTRVLPEIEGYIEK